MQTRKQNLATLNLFSTALCWILFGFVNTLGFASTLSLASTTQIEPELQDSLAIAKVSSPLNFGLDLQLIPTRYPNYQNAPAALSERHAPGIRIGLEWVALATFLGKASIGAGIGYSKIRHPFAPNTHWLESIPMDASISYRLDYVEDQLVVPFGRLGLERTFALQSASSGHNRYDGWQWGAGISILLDRIDKASAKNLDNSVGINNTYLTTEYVQSANLGNTSTANLNRNEFRLGLRFEM